MLRKTKNESYKTVITTSPYAEVLRFMVSEGKRIKPFAGKTKDGFNSKQWCTQFDHEIEHGFRDIIQKHDPSSKLLSEETHSNEIDLKNIWVVDPISHTINFIHGMPHYALVASKVEAGQPVFSCMYDPSMNELFVAKKNGGAYLNGERINVKERESTPMVLYNIPAVGNWTNQEKLQILTRILPLGYLESFASFGINYAYVACGRAQLVVLANKDIYPEYAGKLLVEEAGGIFTDFSGEIFTPDSRGIIAGTKSLHEKALHLLQS